MSNYKGLYNDPNERARITYPYVYWEEAFNNEELDAICELGARDLVEGTIAGKKEAAANPKANATTAATNPGGLIPKYPAIITAKNADILAAINSPFSLTSGFIIFLIKSCETEDEITRSNPAAVDKAAAKAPAARSAITQFGSSAISGLAMTIISLSIVSSLI